MIIKSQSMLFDILYQTYYNRVWLLLNYYYIGSSNELTLGIYFVENVLILVWFLIPIWYKQKLLETFWEV